MYSVSVVVLAILATTPQEVEFDELRTRERRICVCIVCICSMRACTYEYRALSIHARRGESSASPLLSVLPCCSFRSAVCSAPRRHSFSDETSRRRPLGTTSALAKAGHSNFLLATHVCFAADALSLERSRGPRWRHFTPFDLVAQTQSDVRECCSLRRGVRAFQQTCKLLIQASDACSFLLGAHVS